MLLHFDFSFSRSMSGPWAISPSAVVPPTAFGAAHLCRRSVLLWAPASRTILPFLWGAPASMRLRLARLRKRQDRAHAGFDSARVKQSCERLQARGGHLSVKENGPCRQRLRQNRGDEFASGFQRSDAALKRTAPDRVEDGIHLREVLLECGLVRVDDGFHAQ